MANEKTKKVGRERVCGPCETKPEPAEPRQGICARIPINHTAFRLKERQFKNRSLPLDPSCWVDIRDLKSCCLDIKIEEVELPLFSGSDSRIANRQLKMIRFLDFPGLMCIPDCLDVVDEKELVRECYSVYACPQHQTSLDAHYDVKTKGMWDAYVDSEQVLKYDNDNNEQEDQDPYSQDNIVTTKSKGQLVPMNEALVRKLRWITLGYQYDWTNKVYHFDRPFPPVPNMISSLCSILSERCGFGPYNAEAGIVNFYQEKDSLTGHVDRSEKNMAAPLFSFSLGLACVFLVGGKSRDDAVVPLLLRSGDLVIMSGDSRWFYHGVPRIINDTLPWNLNRRECDCFQSKHDAGCWIRISQLIKGTRVNINVRQVN